MNKHNLECLEILNSDRYPEKAGMLIATARHLRRALKQAQHALKTGEGADWALLNAKIDLDFSEYLEEGQRIYQDKEESRDEIADRESKIMDAQERRP